MQNATAFIIAYCIKHVFFIIVMKTHQVFAFRYDC